MRRSNGSRSARGALAILSLCAGLEAREDESVAKAAPSDGMLAAATSIDARLSAQKAALSREQERKLQLSEAQQRLPREREALARTLTRDVRALYRLRRGGLLPMMGGLDAWVEHAARVAQLERMTARALSALERRREEEATLARALEDNAAKLLESTRAIGELEHARARRAQQEADALRLSAAESADGDRMRYGLSLPPGGARVDFKDERGALAAPVPFAERDAAAPRANPRRLVLNAAPGTRVRAAASGTVTYAAAHSRHGLLVTVDHGGGYRTMYGGLDAIVVQVGDTLSKSTALGTTGSGPIHFEVRRGTERLDARAWLGL